VIIAKPNGGLGNRMRVIHSCIALSRENGSPVKVFWKKDPGLNAGLHDIFKPIPEAPLLQAPFYLLCFIASKRLAEKSGIFSWMPALVNRGYHYYDDELVESKRFLPGYWNKGHHKVIFNTCFDFFKEGVNIPGYASLFKPVDKIQERIDEITRQFNEATVGIHIRRTDHQSAKEYSSLHLFTGRIDELLATDSSRLLYLSTDDAATEEQLKKKYPGRIITLLHKDLDRNSAKGIEDAVTDMYCLSKTSLVLGSFASTFSQIAAAIGQVPLIIVKQKAIEKSI